MIARIHHLPEKERILKLARLHAPLTFNGSRISIYPDFSSEVTEQLFNYGTEQKILQNATEAETFIDKFITLFTTAEWDLEM